MVVFNSVAIVGVGLIGGSLALSAREHGMVKKIVGIDADPDTIERANSRHVIDWGTTDLQEGVRDADLVVVATPVRSITPLISDLAPYVRPDAVITDVGSVKKEIVDAVESLPGVDIGFVGGHPIAGTENSGVEAAFPGLFAGRKCVLTPTGRTPKRALRNVSDMWQSLGADVIHMDAAAHDSVFGAVSHLPHYVAFALVSCIDLLSSSEDNLFSFSAGGLKDFTRIAGSDPTMWTDIALMNRSNILSCIDRYRESLTRLRTLIESGDAESLHTALADIRAVRHTRIG
jgi:prephenate dehydrogenase